MLALSSNAGNGHVRNRYGYQGQERENTFALNLNEFEARHYACPDEGGDPQIGRWMVPDPANQFASPYVGMGNEWVSGVDPDGRFLFMPIFAGAVIGAGVSTVTHATTVFLSGGTWKDMNIGKAAGLGALGGAVGAGFSMLGSSLGSIGQSMGYEIMSNVAGSAAVDLAFGNRVTVGSLAGSAIGGLIDGTIPRFKGFNHSGEYSFGDGLLNGLSELGINTARGALIGGLSGGIGAEINGGRFEDGFRNGLRTGAVAAGIRTSINLAVLGPAIRPKGEIMESLESMERNLGINILKGSGTPTFRIGGLWQRGLSVGNSLFVGTDMKSKEGKNTWIHETYHYYQQIKQTWAGQMGRGMYEQWYLNLIKRIDPYSYSGTNEYNADLYAECYYPRK
jgi:RHS repeat-associated protein